MTSHKIRLTIGGQATIDPKRIWPDGDIPELPTADDVINAIFSGSDAHTDLGRIDISYNVTAHVNAYAGRDPDALIPEMSEKRLTTVRGVKVRTGAGVATW